MDNGIAYGAGDIITFLTQSGEELSFKLLGGFLHNGLFYFVAQVVGHEDEYEEDGGIVFRCDGSGDDVNFTLVTDSELADVIIGKYNRSNGYDI